MAQPAECLPSKQTQQLRQNKQRKKKITLWINYDHRKNKQIYGNSVDMYVLSPINLEIDSSAISLPSQSALHILTQQTNSQGTRKISSSYMTILISRIKLLRMVKVKLIKYL